MIYSIIHVKRFDADDEIIVYLTLIKGCDFALYKSAMWLIRTPSPTRLTGLH